MDRKHNDLIGDMLEQSGEKDNYSGPGKGKPLPKGYTERDVYQNFQKVAKDAGYLPDWLRMQKEIAALLQTCETEEELDVINDKIRKHNRKCPSQLQKNLISLENVAKARELW